MENQTPNQPIPIAPPPVAQPQSQPNTATDNPVEKDLNNLKKIFGTIQSKLNKKTLIIIGVVFGIFFVLLILMSIISKSLKKAVIVNKPTPTPSEVIETTAPIASVSGELTPQKINLEDLKKQIDDLDPEQSHLKPPNVNFKIDFATKK